MSSMTMGAVSAPTSIKNIAVSDRAVMGVKAACLEANLSLSTMRRLVQAGQGPRVLKLSVRRIGIRRADLDTWLANRG